MRCDMTRKISWLAAGVVLLGTTGLVGAAEPLELGKPVPDVEAKTHEGKTVKLQEATAKGWALVFFYPKAGTGG